MQMDYEKTKKLKRQNSEQGIVLVIVIIIISILTVVVADLIYFTQIDREISANAVDEMKARYIAKSGIHVAAGTLKGQPLEDLDQIASTLSLEGENSRGFWAINFNFDKSEISQVGQLLANVSLNTGSLIKFGSECSKELHR